MLLIIHLMLSLIQIPGRGNLLLFRRRLPKGEAFCGERQALAVFPLFYQAGPPVAWRYYDRFRATDEAFAAGAVLGSDRETPIPRRRRCTLIVAGDVGASAID